MKLNLGGTTALVAVATMGTGQAAWATEGWYGRADVGYSVDGSSDITQGATHTSLKHSDHVLGSAGVGYAFRNGFRVEAEGADRYNKEKFSGATIAHTNVWSAMVNGYFDFNKGGKLQPYLGVGVGGARAHLTVTTPSSVDDSDTHLAWQGLAGVAFRLTPQLDLDLGYRYIQVKDLKIAVKPGFGASLLSDDYDQGAVTAGLRWQFAPPPPPPVETKEVAPPVVPVCPAQDFKVYFAWDRSDLNAAGTDTINAAAARAKSCNVSTVRVMGYTDRSGSVKYNLGLSNRRAAVVRDALVSAGVSSALISTEGFGETNLDKPTRDGVREPLNRRTAVTISFQ